MFICLDINLSKRGFCFEMRLQVISKTYINYLKAAVIKESARERERKRDGESEESPQEVFF